MSPYATVEVAIAARDALRDERRAAERAVAERYAGLLADADAAVLAAHGSLRDAILSRPDLTARALADRLGAPESYVLRARETSGVRLAPGRDRGGWRAVYRSPDGWYAAGPGGATWHPSAEQADVILAAAVPSAAVAELARATVDAGVTWAGVDRSGGARATWRLVATGPSDAIVRLARALSLRPPR